MKTIQTHWGKLCGIASCLIASVLILIVSARESVADDVPTPGLMITTTNTTNYITITNGVGFANYELYRRITLDPTESWALFSTGSQGQTNFPAPMGIYGTSFYFIGVGTNWDGDSAPNYGDADPTNSAIGWLDITIDTPTNGSIFN